MKEGVKTDVKNVLKRVDAVVKEKLSIKYSIKNVIRDFFADREEKEVIANTELLQRYSTIEDKNGNDVYIIGLGVEGENIYAITETNERIDVCRWYYDAYIEIIDWLYQYIQEEIA